MPNPELYMKKFNVSKGQIYGEYVLSSVKCIESLVVRYQEYKYQIIIKADYVGKNIKPSISKVNNFNDIFYNHISNNLIIYTHYGNPYECTFLYNSPIIEYNDDYSKINMLYIGHARRIKK